jgi:hypothetical protein
LHKFDGVLISGLSPDFRADCAKIAAILIEIFT